MTVKNDSYPQSYKRQLMQQEMADIVDQERTESENREINKLDTKFTNFDKLSDEKVAADAIKLRNDRKKQLEREMLQFEEEKEQFEDDFEEMKTEVIQRNVGKLDNSKTKFDSLEQQREQERLQQLKLNRMEVIISIQELNNFFFDFLRFAFQFQLLVSISIFNQEFFNFEFI